MEFRYRYHNKLYIATGEAPIIKDGEFRSVVDDLFYPDLAARRLRYMHPQREEEAGGSLMRVKKFLARGYNIQPLSLAGVMSRVFKKVDWARLEEGEDPTAIICGLLREVDPLTVVDGVELRDEHRPAKVLDADSDSGADKEQK